MKSRFVSWNPAAAGTELRPGKRSGPTPKVAATMWLFVAAVVLAGCESLDGPGASLTRAFRPAHQAAGDEDHYRRRFQEEGDPDAICWLLTRRLGNGMPLSEVESVLGQDGARVYDDQWIKTGNTGLMRSDAVYKWGPDNRGRSYYLAFREERLVNHDPEVYKAD